MTTAVTNGSGECFDVKRFEESKIGVKGLVDSGITSIPSFFVRPLADRTCHRTLPELSDIIPTIDLEGADTSARSAMVERMVRASRELGFFQVVNHGVPVELMDRMIASIKAFHELPTEAKVRFYNTDLDVGVSLFAKVDLLRTKSASWRQGFGKGHFD